MRRYASSKVELAKALGVSYRALLGWWSRPSRPADHSPGANRYDIEAYRDWIGSFKSAHNFGTGRGAEGSELYEMSPRERAIVEKNRIAAERERFRLAVEKGEYVLRDVANRTIDVGNAIVRRELERMFASELPPRLEGLSATLIRKEMLTSLDRCLARLPKRIMHGAGD